VSWGVLVVSVLSVGTWSVGITLLKAWLEKFVQPELRWIHASLTTVVEDVVDGVVLLKWLSAVMAAWVSRLWSILSWVEEGISLNWGDSSVLEDVHIFFMGLNAYKESGDSK